MRNSMNSAVNLAYCDLPAGGSEMPRKKTTHLSHTVELEHLHQGSTSGTACGHGDRHTVNKNTYDGLSGGLHPQQI